MECFVLVCAAIKSDASAVVWGNSNYGGDTSGVDLTNVATIVCGEGPCVALKLDGSAVGWGGTMFMYSGTSVVSVSCALLHCEALKADGTVTCWGLEGCAADSVTNVVSITCGGYACVAVKDDSLSTAVAWGSSTYGGSAPSSSVLRNVASGFCGLYDCAVLKKDGSVVSWGLSGSSTLTNVLALFGHGSSTYVALKNDHSIETWGTRALDFGDAGTTVDCDDQCVSMPCQNGGICVDGNLAFTFECADGFTGTSCELVGELP
jgi:alpha-tubulin suppressor-like RCC1 family protein